MSLWRAQGAVQNDERKRQRFVDALAAMATVQGALSDELDAAQDQLAVKLRAGKGGPGVRHLEMAIESLKADKLELDEGCSLPQSALRHLPPTDHA